MNGKSDSAKPYNDNSDLKVWLTMKTITFDAIQSQSPMKMNFYRAIVVLLSLFADEDICMCAVRINKRRDWLT